MVKLLHWVAGLGLLLGAGYSLPCAAQQYTGLTGLIHTPSAEMNKEGDARIGVHLINKSSTPKNTFIYQGRKYHTFSHYLSITPFSWVEAGYTCTLVRRKGRSGRVGYVGKDRYFSVKVRPLKEGKWWPAIAVGTNDPVGSGEINKEIQDGNGQRTGTSLFFSNYYIAATKHLLWAGNEWGAHVAFRYFRREYNSDWNGLTGGVTLRPRFYKPLRFIAEYTGKDINLGIDCLVWKHLLLQASLQNGRYPSGGVCFQLNLF